MSLFITCPVQSVERATAFYRALGWSLNAEMSDQNVSCFAIDDPDGYHYSPFWMKPEPDPAA
ncbi:VOC family protein [Microbacterium telephonicum]|uniref:Glyoxalase/Bleomycin resistance-like N-terminal domain-containing protein n=1 Tax=Microbacterium telephonicum TaxID=1714841 RepID=A0A498BU44_9MICO|nr:hypothetical protein [Microbacterium telephonicum]RLK47443.1 hypothetical protein C7474_2025 [Microbacterium telephonicum]